MIWKLHVRRNLGSIGLILKKFVRNLLSLFSTMRNGIFLKIVLAIHNAYKISMQTNNRAITTSSIASSNIQMQRFSMKRFGEIKLSSVRLFRGHFLAPTQFLNTLEKHFSIEYRATRFVLFFPSIVFEHSDTFGFFNEINWNNFMITNIEDEF